MIVPNRETAARGKSEFMCCEMFVFIDLLSAAYRCSRLMDVCVPYFFATCLSVLLDRV